MSTPAISFGDQMSVSPTSSQTLSTSSSSNKHVTSKTESGSTFTADDQISSHDNAGFPTSLEEFKKVVREQKPTSSSRHTISTAAGSSSISSSTLIASKTTNTSLPRLTTSSGDQDNNTSFVNPSSSTLPEKSNRKDYVIQSKADSSSSSTSKRESSSSSTSERVSKSHSLVTPILRNYSGGTSSHTLSSTTPQANASAKIVEGRGIARGEIGISYIDLKNPVLVLSQFADTQAYLRLAVQLDILRPIEILLPHTVMESRSKIISRIREMFPEMLTVTVLRKYFNETKGLQCIQDLCVPEYKTVEIEVSSKYYCLAACAALIKYVEFKQNMTYASHSLRIVYHTSTDTTMISTSTARHLELVTNELGKNEHTLHGVLNYTLTPGGDRLLRANILQPPCDVNTINTRLDCISELMEDEDLFNDLKSVIGKFTDTEHMLSLCVQINKEIGVRNSEQKIANVICLKHSMDLVKPLHTYLAKAKNALFQTYYQALSDERFEELQEKIGLVIHNDARLQKGTLNMHMQKCFAVKSNINGLLDVARRAYTESVSDVADIVKQLERRHGFSLNIGYTSVRGFFIQINSKALPSTEQLPPVFLKVNKCKNNITCTTEDLIKLNDRIRESLNEIYLMSDIIIDQVLNEIRESIGCLYNLTEAVSTIDFLLSLSHACTLTKNVRPEFSNIHAIKDGRHPVIESIIGPTYIPNDTFLCDDQNFIVLSGSNMSGKTTYLKQVAVLQIMAQIGCYIPAEYASIRIADQILTRMGSNSDIEKNYSSFMLQMKEASFILQHVTDKSLIIMDELGNDTNAEEGCAIAYAICEELLMKKAFTICSTHFVQLTELTAAYPNVENYHFRVDYQLNESDGCVCNFTHKFTPGACKDKYYGIKVAELSALPSTIVQEAKKMTENWSETRIKDTEKIWIDEELKEKIKLAIHLIHLSENVNLDENELRNHLRELKSQFANSTPCTNSTQSSSTVS